MLNEKAVFCLPGGPPSNEVAFLQIVLPSLLHLAGREPIPFAYKTATLTATVRGYSNRTQFFYARLEKRDEQLFVRPLEMNSRLQSQADANALIRISEGLEYLEERTQIQVQALNNVYSS